MQKNISSIAFPDALSLLPQQFIPPTKNVLERELMFDREGFFWVFYLNPLDKKILCSLSWITLLRCAFIPYQAVVILINYLTRLQTSSLHDRSEPYFHQIHKMEGYKGKLKLQQTVRILVCKTFFMEHLSSKIQNFKTSEQSSK